MITNENGKLAKKALTKIKIKLILLQKLVEDYNLYESIYKLTTDTSSIVEYIDTRIDEVNPGAEGPEGLGPEGLGPEGSGSEGSGSEEEESIETISITNTEIETMYTTQINETKSSIAALLSEIEGYISNHC